MPESGFEVQPFHPADAEQVALLFRKVYGESYPVRMVYDPVQLVAACESGRYFPFVVRAADGHVVGYGALFPSAPFGGVYEFGQGVVSAEFRGAGIGRLLFEHVEQFPGLFLYAREHQVIGAP